MPAKSPRLRSLSTVVPSHRWAQDDLFQAVFAAPYGSNPKAAGIFEHAAVKHRHVAIDLPTFYAQPQTIETRNSAYLDAALALGREACQKTLTDSGLQGSDIDFFVVA